MDRRHFLHLTGLGAVGLVLARPGNLVAAEVLLARLDPALKKTLADTALEAAKSAGATYCDVRIGRYLQQFVVTRENKVQNVANTESTGVGIRVIAKGTWGFAATSDLRPTRWPPRPARRWRSPRPTKIQTAPVQLAPTKGVGEVSWQTPMRKNAMEVPIKEKVDLLLAANAAAMAAGASFVNSTLFLVNEQKYFASTDGSYIDQDIHRTWAPINVTAVDKETGKFRARAGLSTPVGMGYEYFDGDKAERIVQPGGVIGYRNSYDIVEDAAGRAPRREKLTAPSVKPGKYDLVLDPPPVADHPRIGRPSAGTRPRARLRGQLRRHQLRLAGQAQGEVQVRQRDRQPVRRPHPAAQPRPRRLRRRGRAGQALGPGEGRRAGQLPGDPRPGAPARRGGVARLLLRRLVEQRCSSSACPTSRWRPARRR
jgi:TldD protein